MYYEYIPAEMVQQENLHFITVTRKKSWLIK